MKAPFVLLIFALLASLSSAHGDHSMPPNSASVVEIAHSPPFPQRGDDVRVDLAVSRGANLTGVRTVYCRVQAYACGPPLLMERTAANVWAVTIPWDRPGDNRPAKFWSGVTDVGYNVTLLHANGTNESSPTDHWPQAPAGFESPAYYYFYKLPAEPSGTPFPETLGVLLVLTTAAVLAGCRPRTGRDR